MLKKIIHTVSIIISVSEIAASVYVYVSKVPFKEDLISYNFILILYLVLFYVGGYGISDAIKQSKIPKNQRREKYGVKSSLIVGIFALACGILFGLSTIMDVHDMTFNAYEYTQNKIVSDVIKVNKIEIGYAHSGKGAFRTSTKIISEVDGVSVKTKKEVEFKYCSLYIYQAVEGNTYKVKYLPTTHKLLSIEKVEGAK
ncbi:hypothetical protein [Clostridium felsineum]|uniref:hypothetical protein n=1 Tax=Clostridium felsineum TaxID=36839 RepID=UPI00098CCB9E|nr:hypothetical protein [Clostridium felsineum]URZ04356.1 hypothetical protein CLAUR_044450 [Clostridium felsineum]